MAGALTLGVTVSNVQSQTRGIRVQGGMMAMAFRPNPFMVRPMPFRPSPVVRPMRPMSPAQVANDRIEDRIERERRLWWRNRWWWNNAYGMGNYSGIYGLGYGGSDLGSYGYAPAYQRHEREEPLPADVRPPRSTQEQLEHFVDNPTTDEIFSGQALNTILADLGKLITEQSANDMQASALSLPDEVIAHINVNHGTGNIALLKRKGDLPWPAALNGPEHAYLRAQFASQARAVVQRAQKEGQIDADLIAEMTRGGEQLKKLLPRIARSQTPDSYV